MATRGTCYNYITTPELISQISTENTELMNDFLDYLSSIDRSPKTIKGYKSDLLIFFVWNLQNNKNKYFVELTKREISKFQNHILNEWNWSSNRVRRVKSAISSMSNFIENILDDEIENYRPIIRKIESPVKESRRQKTIIKDEEVDRVLNMLVEKKKYQQACVLALAAMSGARKNELLLYKVSYFDEKNILADAALYQTPEKIRTKGRGRAGKMLTKYCLLDFKTYLDLWMNERESKGLSSEWIFINKVNGEHMPESTLDSYAQTLTKMFGVPFYFHSMRHYLCTKLAKMNLPSKVIQEYFGWSSQEMINIYDDSEASDDFGKFFKIDGIKASKELDMGDI